MSCVLERNRELRWTRNVVPNARISDDYIAVDRDADFALMGYKGFWQNPALPVGPVFYNIRIADHRARYLANIPLRVDEFNTEFPKLQGVGADAKVIVPELVYPRGSKIWIEVTETLGGGPVLLKIVFTGVNRYEV